MAKKIKNYEFKTTRSRLTFDEAWLDGNVWELDESDLGKFSASGAKGKVPVLRYAVASYEGYGCLAEANEANTSVMFQAFVKPKK